MSLNYNRLARTRTISNTQGFYGIKSGTIYLPYDWHVDSWDYICFYLGFDRLSDGGSMIEAGISRRGNDNPRGWYAFVNAWTGMSLKTGTGENWSLWTTSYNNITESGTFTQPSGNDPKYTIEWINQWYEKRIKHNY